MKTLLSALGLAVALAFSMPIIGASSADAATVQNQLRLDHRHYYHHYHHHHEKLVAKKVY